MLRPEDCKPGVMVECIEDGDLYVSSDGVWESPLKFGAIYTIRWGGIYDHPSCPTELCIRVRGIVRDKQDWPFAARRFRLLPDERLAIFRAMLAPIREEAL